MAGAGQEIINGILYVTGTLDRAADTDFQKMLDHYATTTPSNQRIIDMTHVRWLAPTAGKALIALAQEGSENGGKLRVMASRHVMQTLNLLGAKSWMMVETHLTPSIRPGSSSQNPAVSPVTLSAPVTRPSPVHAADPVSVIDIGPGSTSPNTGANHFPTEIENPRSEPFMGVPSGEIPPAHDPAGDGNNIPPNTSTAAATAVAPAVIGGRRIGDGPGPLAKATEELSRGGMLLRVLYANRRYNFHFAGGQNVLGIVRDRVGGAWVVVETTGTRKIINLDMVQICELL